MSVRPHQHGGMDCKYSTITFCDLFLMFLIFLEILVIIFFSTACPENDTCYCSLSTLCTGCKYDLPIAGDFWHELYKGRFCSQWVTWARSSGYVAGLYGLEPWWSGRCSLDLPEAVQSVHVVKLRQTAGWIPSAQGQGQGQDLNTLKVMAVRNKWSNLKFIVTLDQIFGFQWNVS